MGGGFLGMSRTQFKHNYNDIISLENLLLAWQEFLIDKRSRIDVQEFQLRLMQNIIALHNDLVAKTYQHSEYQAFNISDPKPRRIHKAKVRDRLLHRAVYRVLYSSFDKVFISELSRPASLKASLVKCVKTCLFAKAQFIPQQVAEK